MDSPYFAASAYALFFARASMLPAQTVYAGSGVDEDALLQRDYVDWRALARILHNIDAALCAPGWVARVGEKLGSGTHGPLGFAALSAPTLGAALQVMSDYHAVRITTLATGLERLGNRYRFGMRDLTGDDDFGFWIAQSTLRVLLTLVETILGHPAGENATISFAYPRPVYAAALETIYGVPCGYGAARDALTIPQSWYDLPSALSDQGTYHSGVAKCRQIIASQSGGGDVVAQVRNLLASHFDEVLAGKPDAGHPPGLEQIARQLHLTPRTLIRRLKRADSAYTSVLDELRLECATALLQQARYTVADVGHRLGYGDPANFGRAFRKWTGTTPAVWRRTRDKTG